MIVPDVNLLLYANDPVSKLHTQARNWLESVLTGNEFVGFCWPVICGFIRIGTSPRALTQPLEMDLALRLIDDWIGRGHVIVLIPTENHWLVLNDLLTRARVRGAMTSDAEIASYAIEHGGTLYTTDRGFSRYPDLKYVNPLGD